MRSGVPRQAQVTGPTSGTSGSSAISAAIPGSPDARRTNLALPGRSALWAKRVHVRSDDAHSGRGSQSGFQLKPFVGDTRLGRKPSPVCQRQGKMPGRVLLYLGRAGFERDPYGPDLDVTRICRHRIIPPAPRGPRAVGPAISAGGHLLESAPSSGVPKRRRPCSGSRLLWFRNSSTLRGLSLCRVIPPISFLVLLHQYITLAPRR